MILTLGLPKNTGLALVLAINSRQRGRVLQIFAPFLQKKSCVEFYLSEMFSYLFLQIHAQVLVILFGKVKVV